MAKTTTPDFAPDKIEIETKGKMVLLYAITGKERAHMASFFHGYKADYVAEALAAQYDVKIVKKKPADAAPAAKKKPVAKK